MYNNCCLNIVLTWVSNSLGVSEIQIFDTNIIGKQIIDKTLYKQCLYRLDF